MKKFKSKDLIRKVIVPLAILCIVLSPSIVNAQKTSTCDVFDGTAISSSLSQNEVTFTLHAKSGIWKFGYVIGTMNDDGDEDDGATYEDIMDENGLIPSDFKKQGQFDAAEGDKTFTIKRNSTYNKEIIILMWLVDSDLEECSGERALRGKKSFKLDGDFVKLSGNSAIKRTTIPIRQSKSARNQSSNAHCQAMGNAWYYKDGKESKFNLTGTDKNDYVNMMSQSFPYCFRDYSAAFNLSNSTIKNVRQASLKAYNSYLDFKKEASKHSSADYQNALAEAQANGYKKVNDTSLSTLSCDKKSTTEDTKKYYYEKQVVSNSVCSVNCIEQFQVTYDPPVAVKAGLCFQYKVTVRSKVTCKTEIKPGFSWPKAPEPEVTCDYIPICQNAHHSTQAGPSEDFDDCINSCDGGKYTQKCINSCYSKVYENNDTSTNSVKSTSISDKDVNVQPLAGHGKDPFYQVTGCENNGEIINHPDKCGAAFSELKQQYPLGYYRKNNEKGAESWIQYDWHPCFNTGSKHCQYTDDDGKNLSISVEHYGGQQADQAPYINNSSKSYIEAIKRAAPYYTRTGPATSQLIRSFRGLSGGTLPGRKYIIGDSGIKRQKSNRYKCHEVCGFLANNTYGGCSASGASSKDVEEDYVSKLNKIEADFSACTTNAVCKEDKATFYIDVTDKKTYSGKEKEKWTATNQSSSKNSTPPTGGDTSMFIPLECTDAQKQATPLVCDVENVEVAPGINGQCYGRDNPKYWQHYKTTITFPGTWINLKSAERVYKQPNSSSLNNYREKKNYYCTGYDSEDVNVDWWNWKVNGKGNINSIKIQKDNNITADISKFGKFDWSVGLKCFFGLYTKVCVPGSDDPDCNFPEDEDQCSGENSTAICNYKFRVIDQANMFPDEEGLKGNRERGFNWTTKAIDHTIPTDSSYFIDPEKYYQQLEASAETAFPRNDGEFSHSDYRVKLSRENIQNIKSYVRKNNFNTFDGSYHKVTPEVEGLYYYRSGLRNNTSLVSSWTGDVAGKNNN